MEQIINLSINAKFIFDAEVDFEGNLAREHTYVGKNITNEFKFSCNKDFKFLDIIVNGNSVKEHIEKSVDYFDFKSPFTKDTFNKIQKNLTLNIHESDWICVIGPFSRNKIASRPESGASKTFYYITWFGWARPGTNVEITGKQIVTHNQKILDKWILQKKMWGEIGESRARIFFTPPFRYLD